MDAPPEQEDCAPFLRVAGLFSEAGANVPAILAQDISQGFLLLADLGSTTYLQALNGQSDHSGNEAHQLYSDAVGALLKIQLASRPGILPDYDEALLSRELHLFPDWYLDRHLQISLDASQKVELHGIFQLIVRNSLAQPKVFVHRDYHSRNLMVTSPIQAFSIFRMRFTARLPTTSCRCSRMHIYVGTRSGCWTGLSGIGNRREKRDYRYPPTSGFLPRLRMDGRAAPS